MSKALRILASLLYLTIVVESSFVPRDDANAKPATNNVSSSYPVAAPTTTNFTATDDTHLRQGMPTTNYGTATDLVLSSSTTSNVYRPIVEFDISGIPGGQTITSATVYLYYNYRINADVVGKQFWVYKMTQPTWVELEATWNIYRTANNWTAPGGDFVTSSPAGATAVIPGSFGWIALDITAITVDAYGASNPVEILVKWDSSIETVEANRYIQFDSAEKANDPYLSVTYGTAPTVTTTGESGIGETIASLSGNVTASAEAVTQRGVQWGTVTGVYTTNVTEAGSFGTSGTFTANVTGLPDNTTVFWRAMAYSDAWGYGSEDSFTTYDAPDGTSWPVNIIQDTSWAYGIGDIPQHHVYYAAGRHWVIYAAGAGGSYLIYAYTSVDGKTGWTSTSLSGKAFSFSNNIGTAYDGTYLHFAFEWNNYVYYKRGTFNAGGTITWDTNDQQITIASTIQNLNNPMDVAVDSGGHAYISYYTVAGQYVIRNSNTDGTWSTTSGFPYQVNTTGRGVIVPLAGGQVYVLNTATTIKGRLWNGTSWGSLDTIYAGSPPYDALSVSATSHGDVVEVVYLGSDNMTHAATRSAAGTWSTTTVTAAISANANPLLTLWGDSDLRMFYANNNRIYGMARTDGVWDAAATEIVNENTRTMQEPWAEMSVAYNSAAVVGNAHQVGLAYIVGTDPYDVRYFVVSEVAVQTDAATGITSTGMTLNGQITAVSGDNATAVGFEWGWASGAYVESYTDNGSFGTGYAFSTNLTGLWAGETIYYRAYAVNALGTTRGGEATSGTTTPPTTVDDAMYLGKIRIHNDNVTASKSGVSTNMTLASWTSSGYADSDFSNVTIRNADANDDIPFMPARTGTSSWLIHVTPAINANSIQEYAFSSGGPSDMPGDIVYFPDTGGATIVDAASLEPGSVFVLDFDRWYINTSVSDNMCSKPSAILVSTASGNVTAAVTGGPTVTAAVTTGEHSIQVAGFDGDLLLYVDGVLSDNETLAAGVPNTADNWTIARGGSTRYMSRFRIRVSTASGGMWNWENAATFTDDSGNGNTATPTFRTDSTDADVWAELVTFEPAAVAEATGIGGGSESIVDTPDQPSNMYTELAVTAPGAAFINDVLDGANIPRALFWFPWTFLLIMLVSFAVTWGTKSNVMKAVVLWLCFLVAAASGVFGWWLLIPFAIELASAIVAMRKASW